MTFTMALGQFSHDVRVGPGGTFERVQGADEVRQRVKVAVWHYLAEYFLDTPQGVPYYTQVMGRKNGAADVSAILRNKILRVPGVIRVVSFAVKFNTLLRVFEVTGEIEVESGPGDAPTVTQLNLQVDGDENG